MTTRTHKGSPGKRRTVRRGPAKPKEMPLVEEVSRAVFGEWSPSKMAGPLGRTTKQAGRYRTGETGLKREVIDRLTTLIEERIAYLMDLSDRLLDTEANEYGYRARTPRGADPTPYDKLENTLGEARTRARARAPVLQNRHSKDDTRPKGGNPFRPRK